MDFTGKRVLITGGTRGIGRGAGAALGDDAREFLRTWFDEQVLEIDRRYKAKSGGFAPTRRWCPGLAASRHYIEREWACEMHASPKLGCLTATAGEILQSRW